MEEVAPGRWASFSPSKLCTFLSSYVGLSLRAIENYKAFHERTGNEATELRLVFYRFLIGSNLEFYGAIWDWGTLILKRRTGKGSNEVAFGFLGGDLVLS